MRRRGASLVFLLVANVSSFAFAQSTPEAQVQARTEMKQAIDDLDGGNFESAHAHCRKASLLTRR